MKNASMEVEGLMSKTQVWAILMNRKNEME